MGSWIKALCALFGLTVVLAWPGPVRAAEEFDLLPDIELGSISVTLSAFGSLRGPTSVTTDANGRLFVTEISGGIVTFDPVLQGASQTTYHIPPDVLPFNPEFDRGMTTITPHPDFLNPGMPGYGKFYTVEPNQRNIGTADFMSAYQTGIQKGQHKSVLYEYTADDPAAATFTGTRRQILSLDQRHHSHNLDDIAFGPDGLMYVSSGDHGNEIDASHNYAQSARDLDEPYGKILRIDPLINATTPPGEVPADREVSANGQFSVPTDNPFFDDNATPEARDMIWAYGLRNPFRIGFDRQTGDLYSSDTGQHNIESINHILPGHDYGWNIVEGSFFYEGPDTHNPQEPGAIPPKSVAQAVIDGDLTQAFVDSVTFPTFEYDHQEGETIIGGFVYRGSAIPQLVGKYVFGEFVGVRDNEGPSPIDTGTGARLFYGDLDTGVIQELIVDEGGGHVLPDHILGFGQTPDGELYFVGFDLDGFLDEFGVVQPTGRVYQLLPTFIPEPGAGMMLLAAAGALLRRW